MQYAGLWVRFGAAVIDGILTSIVSGLLFWLFFEIGEASSSDYDTQMWIGWGGGWIAMTIFDLIYFAGMESSTKQATLGKRAAGIVVTDLEGSRISFGRAVLRFIEKGISGAIFLGVLLIVSCFTIAFTQKKQAIHDMTSKCLVIKR